MAHGESLDIELSEFSMPLESLRAQMDEAHDERGHERRLERVGLSRHHGKHNRLTDAFCGSPRCGRWVKSLEHQATAALQHLASDPRSVVACQEGHRFGDILGLAEATERRLSNHTVEHFLRYAGTHVCFR